MSGSASAQTGEEAVEGHRREYQQQYPEDPQSRSHGSAESRRRQVQVHDLDQLVGFETLDQVLVRLTLEDVPAMFLGEVLGA